MIFVFQLVELKQLSNWQWWLMSLEILAELNKGTHGERFYIEREGVGGSVD